MVFIGIVENNVDTEKLGRCQVRIFGKHPESRDDYPTEDLPWAHVLSQGPNISEESTFTIPNQGDNVLIVFVDPEEQIPVILGSFPKILKTIPDFSLGFSDPDQVYPDSDHVDESGISRLARNENIDQTIIQGKKNDKKTGVSCGDATFDEPETPYAAVYPSNKVINTKYHVIEIDDTSGAERIHIYHKSGSSIEYHPNGDVVERVKAKKFIIIESDENSYVGGDLNIHIEGDENKEIGGTQKETVSTKEINTTGDITIQSGGSVNITASGQVNIQGTIINLN